MFKPNGSRILIPCHLRFCNCHKIFRASSIMRTKKKYVRDTKTARYRRAEARARRAYQEQPLLLYNDPPVIYDLCDSEDDNESIFVGNQQSLVALSTFHHENSHLHCCVVQLNNTYSIVFRLSPSDNTSPGGTFAERVWHDAIKNEEKWISDYHIDDNPIYWYDNNVAQTCYTDKGCSLVRLFIIHAIGTSPDDKMLINLGLKVCENLNNAVGNATVTTFDSSDFFWIRNPTWEAITSKDVAFAMPRLLYGPLAG
jgi:hypothetical protein